MSLNSLKIFLIIKHSVPNGMHVTQYAAMLTIFKSDKCIFVDNNSRYI